MLYLKALHIIFMVTWFAGLFYIVRLFVYDAEAVKANEPDRSILQNQFRLMQKRLWFGITWPGMVLTLLFGIWMVWENSWYLSQDWFLVKLGFVFGLLVYHLICHRYFISFQKGTCSRSGRFFRIWNEVATLFLFAIVFLVVMRDSLSWLYGVGGLIFLAAILMAAIGLYRKWRAKK